MIKRHKFSEPRKAEGRNSSPATAEATPKTLNGNKPKAKSSDWFHKLAHKTSEFVGKPWTFIGALLTIIVWAILGPIAGFSDTWQLIINTATTIVTFLMVFLIQNTQNRDAKAIHLKLDELIHAMKGARNKLIDLENCSDAELAELQEQFKRLGKANQPTAKRGSQEPE